MARRVLHLLSQRPSLPGSGVTLDALVRHGAEAGWEQRALVGAPAGRPVPEVGGLSPDRVSVVEFGGAALPFPVPGMSDLMPYDSSRFSTMSEEQVSRYEEAWREAIQRAASFEPDVVHSHHVWLMSSVIKDVLPKVPVVTHCHATGLRQMALCPDLAERVRAGCRRNDRFAVLHEEHARLLAGGLGVGGERIVIVGAGYNEEIFHDRGREASPRAALYAGKLARAKGLPWLLDAVESLSEKHPDLVLHVAGGGDGAEADALRGRMEAMGRLVTLHGRLDQRALGALMRRCALLVLPSLFEGLPLVLVEAAACGCPSVATRLTGVEAELAPRLGPWLTMVDPPGLEGPDEPRAEDLPRFVTDLEAALDRALEAPPGRLPPRGLEPFTWGAVYRRVEAAWLELVG